MTYYSAWGCTYNLMVPLEITPQIFVSPWGAPPGYAYGVIFWVKITKNINDIISATNTSFVRGFPVSKDRNARGHTVNPLYLTSRCAPAAVASLG